MDFGLGGYTAVTLKRGIQEGLVIGPEMMVCGRPLCMTGGHCHKNAHEVDGVDGMIRGVREELKEGADFIKFMASGGLDQFPREDPKYPELTLEELKAGIGVAHDAGRPTTAHVYPKEAILRIIQAGIDCVEHGVMMDDECIDEMVKHNLPLVPTMTGMRGAYFIPPVSEARMKTRALLETRIWQPHNESVRKAVEAGLLVGTGTDSYGRLSDEIRLIAPGCKPHPCPGNRARHQHLRQDHRPRRPGPAERGQARQHRRFPRRPQQVAGTQSTVPTRFGYTARRSCNLKNGKEGNHHETNFT